MTSRELSRGMSERKQNERLLTLEEVADRLGVRPRFVRGLVAEQVTEINGQFRRGAPKSEAGLRSVALPRFVVGALKEHLATWAEPGAAGLVFPASEGGWMRRSNFRRRVWLPATKAVGVEGLRFHDLRHSAATLAAAGATTKELMARIGHSTHEAAIRYQHVMDGRDAAIAEALDALGGRVVSIHSAKSKRGMGRRAEGTQRARAKRGERQSQHKIGADQRESRSGRRDLNPRPPAPKAGALPNCATSRR